jgi:NEDD8-activating enzyme E1 regulatory subunit
MHRSLTLCRCRCRYEASELHAVASIMGGIAAQEAVKILTQQYVPLRGTLLFNGISCVSTVFDC